MKRTSRRPKRRSKRSSRRNATRPVERVSFDDVVRHINWTDPDAIGMRSMVPTGDGEDMEWTLERWKTKDLPRPRVDVRSKARRYKSEIQAGSEPPAVVIAETRPVYDEMTGKVVIRPRMEIWDGNHRIAAAQEADLSELDAYVGRRKV